MPHEKLEAAAAKLRAKAKARRSKRKKKTAKQAGERVARKRRIERNDPDGVVERAKATAKQAREAGDAAREFASETAPVRGAQAARSKAEAASEQASGVADAVPEMAPPQEQDMLGGFEVDAVSDTDVNRDGDPDRVLVDLGGGSRDASREDDDPLDDLLI